jgi:peptide/bleomycin uptake transporter
VYSFVAMLLESGLTMVVFLPILHDLDPQLLYVALGTAVGGIGVSAFVGKHLVSLENANQRVEASFRKQLVLLETDATLVLRADGRVLSSFDSTLASLTDNYMRLYAHFAALNFWLGSWDQAAVVLPYLLAAPKLFPLGDEEVWSLGRVVQATNAFSKIFDSINVVSDSFMAINEWRSVLARLRGFEASQKEAENIFGKPKDGLVSSTELLPGGAVSALPREDERNCA